MLPGVRRLDFAAQRPILCMRRGNAVCVMFPMHDKCQKEHLCVKYSV